MLLSKIDKIDNVHILFFKKINNSYILILNTKNKFEIVKAPVDTVFRLQNDHCEFKTHTQKFK